MKKTILLLVIYFLSNYCFAQQKEAAKQLVDAGIAFHEKEEYGLAILKYDSALMFDKDNIYALAEKALTLVSLKKYEEAIKSCQRAIEVHHGDEILQTVFVTYGNALDGLKKTDKSLEMYDEGIKQFPDYYQLYYNKGVTLSGIRKYDEAILCFQKVITLNPAHPGSNNAIAKLLNIKNHRIPALLAYCRFLIIEPQTSRAKANLETVQLIMKANVKKTGDGSVTLNVGPDMLSDINGKGKQKENNFATADMILTMDAAMDYDEKNINKSEVEQFIRKFETVCNSLKESLPDNHGFYWDYYVPYFLEIKDKKFMETFAHIAFASSEKADNISWLKSHNDDIVKFYDWTKNYSWPANTQIK